MIDIPIPATAICPQLHGLVQTNLKLGGPIHTVYLSNLLAWTGLLRGKYMYCRYAVGDLSKEIHGIYWDIHKTEDTKQNSLVVGTALLAIFLSQRGSLLRHSSRQSVDQTWGHGGGTKASRTLLILYWTLRSCKSKLMNWWQWWWVGMNLMKMLMMTTMTTTTIMMTMPERKMKTKKAKIKT